MSAKLSSKNFYGGNLMVKCFVALVIFFCSVGNLFAQTETKVTINVDKVLIRTALERLQKETKVHFVYEEEELDIINATSVEIVFKLLQQKLK